MNDNFHKELQGGVAKHWNDINLKNLVEEYIEIVVQKLEPNEEIDFTKTIIETISSYLNCKLFGLKFEDKTCLFGCLSHSSKSMSHLIMFMLSIIKTTKLYRFRTI
jgi:hypothetical protein